jgi:hypothetical protein
MSCHTCRSSKVYAQRSLRRAAIMKRVMEWGPLNWRTKFTQATYPSNGEMKDPNWLLQSVAAVTKERYGAPKVLYQL